MLLWAAWGACLLYFWLRMAFWACPQCGERFHGGCDLEASAAFFAGRCVYCGLQQTQLEHPLDTEVDG